MSLELLNLQYDNLSQKDKIDYCLEILKNIPEKKILVDGVANAGKGTLSEKIARDLDLIRVSTGDMYRVITWYLLQKGLTNKDIVELDDDQLQQELSKLEIEFVPSSSSWWVKDPNTREDQNVSNNLRSEQIDKNISTIVKRDPVRDIVDQYQRKIIQENSDVFFEGRDMWQVFKGIEGITLIYLYASNKELINREIGRQRNLGNHITKKDAKLRAIDRNIDDNNRDRGKLLLPEEVEAGDGKYQLIIDTTGLEPDEVYLLVLEKLCKELGK